jgi:sulfur-oxidizing protein SoxY
MNAMSPAAASIVLVSRRAVLRQLGAASLWLGLWPGGTGAAPETLQRAIQQRIGDRKPHPGGITLSLPKIAETGNSVPLTIAVDSPMTPVDHVQRIHLFVPGNPEPVASTYHLGIRCGRAQISTQIRLARTQTVLVLAEMSDGSVRSEAASIIVTLGACVDELWSD